MPYTEGIHALVEQDARGNITHLELIDGRPTFELEARQSLYVANLNGGDSMPIGEAPKFEAMPKVDPTDSAQNGWVQDWLTAWANRNMGRPTTDAPGDHLDDWRTYESAIELIQETWGSGA